MTSTDEQRWADAEAVLRGDTSADQADRIRRRQRRLRLLLVGLPILTAVVVVVAVLVSLLLAGHGQHHAVHREDVPAWRAGLGLGLSALGVIGGVAALVLLFRKNPWKGLRSPVVLLTWRQRRSLVRQIQGKAPVDREHLPLALHVADRLLFQRRAVAVYPALLVIWAGQAVQFADIPHVALGGVYAVLILTATPFLYRQVRSARRFLDRYGPSGGDAGTVAPAG